MADEPIDRLFYAIDGDVGPLKQAGRQADAEFARISTSAKANLGDAFKPLTAGAQTAAAEIEKARARISPFFADTAAGSQKLMAARTSFDEVTAAVTRSHGATATATREFRALFDELSSGRVRQTPGTLAIIATRVFGVSGATLAWGAALAAIPIALGVAAAASEQAFARIQRSVAATGYATGATASSILSQAQTLDGVNGMSQPGAARVMSGLSARGDVSAGLLNSGAQAASGYALATGQKSDKAVEEFEKALAEPAKGAKELNDQMKLLSAAQTREVEDLTASGQVQQAQKVIIDAMNERTKLVTQSLGSFDQFLQKAGQGLSDFWARVGKQAVGPQSASEKAFAATENYENAVNRVGGHLYSPDQIADLKQKMDAAVAAARQEAIEAQQGQRRNGQDQSIQAMLEYRSKLDVANRKIDEENNARTAITAGLQAAREQLSDLQKRGAPAGEIAAAQANVTAGERELANANNPNYKWGSGVPQRVRNEGLSGQSAIDAATKSEIEAQIALTRSLTQRATLQGQLFKIEDDARKTALAKQVADKAISPGAAARAGSLDDAAEADRKALAARQLQEGLEDKQAAYDQQLTGYKVQALQAAASLHITEQERVKIQLQIMEAEQEEARQALARAQSRDPNLSPEQKTAQAAALANAQGAQRSSLQSNAQYNADAPVRALQEEIQLQQASLNLKYADATERAKELADLRLRNQLLQEGFKPGTDQYNAEYGRRAPLVQQQAALSTADQTPEAQELSAFRKGLEDIGTTGVTNFKNLGNVASNFLQQLEQMTVRLYIMQPLLNMLMGTGGGAPGVGVPGAGGGGGLLGSIFSGLLGGGGGAAGAASAAASATAGLGDLLGTFGGFAATGAYVDPSKFYVVGEKGPEILGPGLTGAVKPIAAPDVSQTAPQGSGNTNVNHTYAITVSGNGDKELMGRMQTVATSIVQAGLAQYDKASTRTQRGSFIQQNKKALY